ncbi:AraC family transcriptional regulator [Pedobacter sp. L105]|uniref:helix-turn-helix domain-containing protein n=1 Tax=Pedobacter sp. L105 TaxID=1641871 RepID=UPI00131AF77F|nr:helix-turn-helix transcriptional regulator [Pedobacter sp. L105]
MRKKTDIAQFHLHKDEPQKLQFQVHSLNAYLLKNTKHTLKPHVHSYYQIIWFKKGYGKHFVDFKAYDIQPNSVFFISKNQIHYFDSYSMYEGLLVHFNQDFLLDSENSTDILLKYNIFNNLDKDPFFIIPDDSVGKLDHLIGEFEREILAVDKFAHKEYLQYLLKLFLISIQRLENIKPSNIAATNNQNHVVALKFKQILEINFKQLHTVQQYADLLNVSAKTLTNYTNSTFIKSPLKIISERITLEAKRLLWHSDSSINEISFQLGFDDPSYFVKFFKKQTEMLPKQFRSSIS